MGSGQLDLSIHHGGMQRNGAGRKGMQESCMVSASFGTRLNPPELQHGILSTIQNIHSARKWHKARGDSVSVARWVRINLEHFWAGVWALSEPEGGLRPSFWYPEDGELGWLASRCPKWDKS